MSVISINNRPAKASPIASKFREWGARCGRFCRIIMKMEASPVEHDRTFRAITDEANDLIRAGDPHLVTLGDIGKRVKQRLDACTPKNRCNVIGCPKCSKIRVLERTEQLCNQALRFHTKNPRSMLITFGIGSQNWNGDIDSGKFNLAEDMNTLVHKVLKRMSIIKGFSLHLDANPMVGDTNLDAPGRAGVLTREQTGWHLHIHGTLAVQGEGSERLETVRTQLNELCGLLNLELEFYLKEVDYNKPRTALPGESVLIQTDKYNLQGLANWNSYAMKTVAGEAQTVDKKLIGAEGFRVLQRHLVGCQMEWAGGVLARKDSELKPIEDARGCVNWIGDMSRLFNDLIEDPTDLQADNVDIGMINRNLKDLRQGLASAEELLKQCIAQRCSIVRQRRRRKRRLAKLQGKFTGNLLREEIAKVKRRSARDKAKAEQSRALRQNTIDLLLADVKQCIERVFRRTVRIIAGMNPIEINRRVIVAELTGSDRLQAAIHEIAAAGMIYSVRKKVRDLTTGAGLLARQGIKDGTDERALDRAVELSFSLDRWNCAWPCWLTDETIKRLDWDRWWSHWHERHFLRVCAGR